MNIIHVPTYQTKRDAMSRRTMQEAFGPYTSNVLHPMQENENADKIVGVACMVLFALSSLAWYFLG